ncbi:MAG: ATP-binding protein, partial [Actinomycetota bacterium]|nr:ATP-binding protein [Actinomycetota bacterium]
MKDPDRRTVSLAVPSDPEFLVFARLALGAVCRLTPLRSDEVIDLKLAVTEAAAGVLDEGGHTQVSDRIGFVFHLDSDRLVLEVRGSLPSDVPLED